MKTFFDAIFIDSGKLQDEGIEYPIKLEYYKTVEVEENVEAKYGVEIVKTEYKNNNVNVESKQIKCVTNSVEEIDKIITVLKNNEVTPIAAQDVLDDMLINV